MLGGFVLGDHITRVMEGLIVQVLVSGVVKGDVRIAYRLHYNAHT